MNTTVSNRYSPEYKLEAINLARSLGNVSEAARQLNVHVNTLSRWVKESDGGSENFPGDSHYEDKKKVEEEVQIKASASASSLPTNSIDLNSTISQLEGRIEELTNKVEDLEKEKAQLQRDLQTLHKSTDQLQKDLLNSQQYIGRMYIENEKLKEKIANRTEEF